MIVRSDGSLMTRDFARVHPVKTILSGPAASVMGARRLAKEADCIIVDMGGTTTDISIVENDKPIMTTSIGIGGFKTQVRGVYTDTFGLGGDSRIWHKDAKPLLETRRVQPLCIAATQHEGISHFLKKLSETSPNTFPLHEFFYLVKEPEHPQTYSKSELEIIDILKEGAFSLAFSGMDLYNINTNRLESEGLIMRCGLTPTDIMHIKGDFARFDAEASLMGAEFFVRMLNKFGDSDVTLDSFCNDIYDLGCKKLYENIVRIMLSHKNPRMFGAGIDAQVSNIIEDSWHCAPTQRFFSGFEMQYTLIGIGAPIGIFLPKVAEKLNTEFILPEHAEVANALGALVADIMAHTRVKVSPKYSEEGLSGYKVVHKEGREFFVEYEDAIEYAKKKGEAIAVKQARQHGSTGELTIDTQISANTAIAQTGEIELDTLVEVTAVGRV